MRNLSITFVAVLGLLAVGCGGGGTSVADLCAKAADCAIEEELIEESQRGEFITECESSEDEDPASDDCRDCLGDASCAELFDQTTCADECADDVDALTRTSQMEPEQLASLGY